MTTATAKLPKPTQPVPVANAVTVPVDEISPASGGSVGKKMKRRSRQSGGSPILQPGGLGIPNILVRRQRTLGLDSIDVNILLHLDDLLAGGWKSAAPL